VPPGGGWAPGPEIDTAITEGVWSTGKGICGDTTESEPNDARETASVLALGTDGKGCLATGLDTDYFQVTAPTDKGQGYLQATIVPESGAPLVLEAEHQSATPPPTNLFRNLRPEPVGSPYHFVIPTQPGQVFRIKVTSADIAKGFKYGITVRHGAVPDSFEPNDSTTEAKPIAVGSPQTAYFFAGIGDAKSASGDDFFSTALQPGPTTLDVADVAANVLLSITVVGPSGRNIYYSPARTAGGPQMGQGFAAKFTTTEAGTHVLKITGTFPLGPRPLTAPDSLPENYVKPYRILVTQP
jgi:hypothetical protein